MRLKSRLTITPKEKDSLSQQPFEEGSRVIYGRASQYAPLVIRAYEARRVPPCFGTLSSDGCRSEYHDCPAHPHPTGPVGIVSVYAENGGDLRLERQKRLLRCGESSPTRRRVYMSDLTSDFGDGKSSATLGLLGYRDWRRQTRAIICGSCADEV